MMTTRHTKYLLPVEIDLIHIHFLPTDLTDQTFNSTGADDRHILNYKRLCPSVSLSVSHIMLPDICWFKHLNAFGQGSETDLNI